MINEYTAVQTVMTLCPCTVDINQSVNEAAKLMEMYEIRHFPVLLDHKIIGVISHRDIQFAQGWARSLNLELEIRDVYIPEPYIVQPTTFLLDVVEQMWRDRIGCAVAVVEDRAVGIVTTTDVCRLLAQQIRENSF